MFRWVSRSRPGVLGVGVSGWGGLEGEMVAYRFSTEERKVWHVSRSFWAFGCFGESSWGVGEVSV